MSGEVVVAEVVARPGAELSDAEFDQGCRQRIAGYNVPRRFIRLGELPRTGSGKIARATLRSRFAGPAGSGLG